MKTTNQKTKQTKGFTLIEMIGVLAVIAILAALLIPKVFAAITESKINTVPVGCATVKTAVIDNYAKWGGLNMTNATGEFVPAIGYDIMLMAGGFLDKPFAPRVGTTAVVQLTVPPGTGTVDGATPGMYDLDGNDGNTDVVGAHVVEAVITGVPIADAQAISFRIDGGDLSQAEGAGTADIRGRVIYDDAADPTTVYIYLTHR